MAVTLSKEVAPGPTASARPAAGAGILYAVAGAALFSGKAIVIKLAYRDYVVDAATLIALRMAFAVPLFAIALWWVGRRAPPLRAGDHARLVAIGLVGYYAASYLDFLGLRFISAGLERLVLYMTPTLVLLMTLVVLRRRVHRAEATALLVSYGGIALVVWHDVALTGPGVPLGVGLVFLSALCYAAYLVAAGEMVRRVGAIRLTSYAMCVSTAACLVQFIALKPLSSLALPAGLYALSAFNGVACTVLPVFATMLAVERIGAGRAALAANVGPVATIVFGYLLLGEPISAWQVAGTALVLFGVFMLTRATPREPLAAVRDERPTTQPVEVPR